MSSERPSRRTRRAAALRDQSPSEFALILTRLVASTPGALAAALVDSEGETVDYAGSLDVFDIKVAAAHWQIVVAHISAGALGPTRQILVHARARSYVIRAIEEGYMLVLVVHRHAAFASSERALLEAEARVRTEAAWPPPPRALRWFGVDVEADTADPLRPARVLGAHGWQNVEVIGAMVDLPRRERGFRVRVANGAEVLLVRERLGRWFADEYLSG